MQKIITTVTCDMCKREESDDLPVKTHQLSVDGMTVEIDVCTEDWPAPQLAALLVEGRKPVKKNGRSR